MHGNTRLECDERHDRHGQMGGKKRRGMRTSLRVYGPLYYLLAMGGRKARQTKRLKPDQIRSGVKTNASRMDPPEWVPSHGVLELHEIIWSGNLAANSYSPTRRRAFPFRVIGPRKRSLALIENYPDYVCVPTCDRAGHQLETHPLKTFLVKHS
jgi:hypothetical protein